MDRDLAIKILLGLATMPIVFGVPIFMTAGTMDYWQGWLFIGVFFFVNVLLTLYLLINDPALLRRRMKSSEPRSEQRTIMKFVYATFFLIPVISALDYRFAWSHLSASIVFLGEFLIAFSYLIFFWVMKENSYAGATIELAEGQHVISSGPYHYVRHPMYAGAVFLLIGMPLALGSLWSLLIVPVALAVLHFRIVDEEKFLATELPGYPEYCRQVKYRLVPGVY